jgi:hypothetical protein
VSDEQRPPYLTVTKFFERHQHYHHRESMPWIKLDTATMHDKKIRRLSPNARFLWYEMLQLAGYYMNAIPNDVAAIARECDKRTDRVGAGLKELLNAGLLREAMRKPRASREAPRRVTGFRLVRGSHGSTYIPDPRGTDRLPKFYGKDAA